MLYRKYFNFPAGSPEAAPFPYTLIRVTGCNVCYRYFVKTALFPVRRSTPVRSGMWIRREVLPPCREMPATARKRRAYMLNTCPKHVQNS